MSRAQRRHGVADAQPSELLGGFSAEVLVSVFDFREGLNVPGRSLRNMIEINPLPTMWASAARFAGRNENFAPWSRNKAFQIDDRFLRGKFTWIEVEDLRRSPMGVAALSHVPLF